MLPVAPLEVDWCDERQVEHVVFGVSLDQALDAEQLLAASGQVERVGRGARRVHERRLQQIGALVYIPIEGVKVSP